MIIKYTAAPAGSMAQVFLGNATLWGMLCFRYVAETYSWHSSRRPPSVETLPILFHMAKVSHTGNTGICYAVIAYMGVQISQYLYLLWEFSRNDSNDTFTTGNTLIPGQ